MSFKIPFDWVADYDKKKRQCVVRLYERSLDEYDIAKHWALHFDWGNCNATYEGLDEDGYLVPKWNSGKPDTTYNWSEVKQMRLVCSPNQVNSTARGLSLNGQIYIITKCNCHTWAEMLAEKLGFKIDQPIEKYIPPDVSNIIDFVFAAYNLFWGASSALSTSSGLSASSGSPSSVIGRSTALVSTTANAICSCNNLSILLDQFTQRRTRQ